MEEKKKNEIKIDEAKSLDKLSEQEINGKKVKGGGISVNLHTYGELIDGNPTSVGS